MALHFALAPHDGADSHTDNMWFFQVEYDCFHDLSVQLEQLLKHPKRFIHDYDVKPRFAPGPIVLVFEYGPFTDSWYVHGVEGTNVVSVRCPPLPGMCSQAEPFIGTNVNVVYLQSPMIAFAHFDPKEAGVDFSVAGQMLAEPTRFPTLLNAQEHVVRAAPPVPNGGADTSAPNTSLNFSKARFVLSPNFRFRYEAHFLEAEEESVEDAADAPEPVIQCVKFAGVYSAGHADTLVMQIDEAWSMIWQESSNKPGP